MAVGSAAVSDVLHPAELRFDVGGAPGVDALHGLDWGGDGPDVLFLHANGFCAGSYEPVVAALRGTLRCFALDLWGHGRTAAPHELSSMTMEAMAADVAAVLDAWPSPTVQLVGHSLGGIVATLVERERPERVRRLVLCEPVILAPPPLTDRTEGPSPMSDAARRRRRVWPDRETMRERYAARPPMDGFTPAALDAYLRYGVRDRDDGTVELACDPELEAAVFEMTPGPRGGWPAWEHLARLRTPTTIVSGRTTALPPGLFAMQAERAGCEHVELDGGHLFPHEDPAATARLLASLLR